MNVLFDIGNVILHIDFISSLKKVIPAHLEDVDERLDRIMLRKDEFEAGKIPIDEYFLWAVEQLEMEQQLDEFMHAWLDIFTPNLPMWRIIEQLHAEGHRLFLFSNVNNPHKDHILKNYPIFEKFSGGVFSYQTGHIKPEAAIYQRAIEQCQIIPEQTIYIDDLADNITAGKAAGLHSHQYRADEHEAFKTWLESITDSLTDLPS